MRPVSNPPNPWESTHAEWIGEPPEANLEVFEEEARSIVTENASPDIPMRFSVNPYRGCFHACSYCFARSSHEYLGFGAGTDFERKIVVKVNAPEKLREHFEKPSWKGDSIAFSGNTDCYQPLEACYRLTRRCLEVCLEYANPVGLITKSALVRRDVGLLANLSKEADVSVCLSICFSDDRMSRAIEPNTSPPSQRFETLRILSDAGIRTAVGIAPVIPGLNDSQIVEILEKARNAGASSAFLLPIRLSGRTLDVFRERLAEAYPARLTKIWNAIRELRGGSVNDTRFGYRLRGEGSRWAAIESLFEAQCRRLGFSEERMERRSGRFRRPSPQKPLFD